MAYGTETHDIVVLGASSGGLEALRLVLSNVPPDLPASLFVVLHMGSASTLAQALGRHSTLPVELARSGAVFRRGRIYVAVPGHHLLLHNDHILLRRGPRENYSRPAIDPLFRSAAVSFTGRVIGVLLSGALNDGTAGLAAIKRCGGLVVVQDPADALAPEMPQSALRHVSADHILPAADIGPLLGLLTQQPASLPPETPLEIRLEAAIAAQELADMKVNDMLGEPSRFTCPECHGALWEIRDGNLLRFRCHVGHAYTADGVLDGEDEEVDRLLGTLLRSHQERAALAHRMSTHERSLGNARLADHLARRAAEYEDDAQLFKGLLRDGVGEDEALDDPSHAELRRKQET